MNRKIKFRAWNPQTEQMFEVSGMDFALMSVISPEQNWSEFKNGEFRKREQRNCILMQFIGLKDKNGKEIYEGDIVIQGNIEPLNKAVKYSHQKSGFYLTNKKWVADFNVTYGDGENYIDSTIEIIGNIYENSELLK